MKKFKFTITEEDQLKMEKAGRRQAEIEEGIYGEFTKNRIHASKKSYSRRDKHRKSFI